IRSETQPAPGRVRRVAWTHYPQKKEALRRQVPWPIATEALHETEIDRCCRACWRCLTRTRRRRQESSSKLPFREARPGVPAGDRFPLADFGVHLPPWTIPLQNLVSLRCPQCQEEG